MLKCCDEQASLSRGVMLFCSRSPSRKASSLKPTTERARRSQQVRDKMRLLFDALLERIIGEDNFRGARRNGRAFCYRPVNDD